MIYGYIVANALSLTITILTAMTAVLKVKRQDWRAAVGWSAVGLALALAISWASPRPNTSSLAQKLDSIIFTLAENPNASELTRLKQELSRIGSELKLLRAGNRLDVLRALRVTRAPTNDEVNRLTQHFTFADTGLKAQSSTSASCAGVDTDVVYLPSPVGVFNNEGEYKILFIIGEAGRVLSATLLSSSNAVDETLFTKYAEQWRFKPIPGCMMVLTETVTIETRPPRH